MIIKILLLAAAVGIAVAAARTSTSPGRLALRRLGILVTLAMAVLAVLFPGVVTAVARLVGVGRGTDLVLYAFMVVAVVGWLGSCRRLAELDDRLASLVRSQALAGADRDRSPTTSMDP
jgi:small membrane protein